MDHTMKAPSSEPAIRLVMLPKYTNPDGDIFGGVILSMSVGDIISLRCRTLKISRSSAVK